MYVCGQVPTHGEAEDNMGVNALLPCGCWGHEGSLTNLPTDLFYWFWDVWWGLKPVFHPALVSEEQDEAGSRQHQQQYDDAHRDQNDLLLPGEG